MNRPSFDQLYIGMALWISKRSSCMARQTGAVIVKEKRVLATGYNGAPPGIKNCVEKGEIGCPRRKAGLKSGVYENSSCHAVHAEENAMLFAAKFGISINGATMYMITFPCSMCAKALISAGIREIVYVEDYDSQLTKELLEEANIMIRKIDIEPVKEFMRNLK